jgi:DNA-binding NtrC family response regulator
MNSSVLIIDDDPRFTRQMEFALSKEGYKVWTAATASVAMELVNRMPFNCAIIDVHLPDVLGIALTEQIKQSSPQTEIIIMTAFGTIEDGVKAMKAGAMDYSVKIRFCWYSELAKKLPSRSALNSLSSNSEHRKHLLRLSVYRHRCKKLYSLPRRLPRPI